MSSNSLHRIQWVARGVREVSRQHGVALPLDYSLTLVRDGLAKADSIGVSKAGQGVVFHTAPDPHCNELPVLLGYADRSGAWYRDGRRHSGPDRRVAPAGAEMSL